MHLLMTISVKTQYLYFKLHANYFLLPWKISKKKWLTTNDLPKLKTVSTIWNMYVHTSFYNSSEWQEIWCLMEVSTIHVFYIEVVQFLRPIYHKPMILNVFRDNPFFWFWTNMGPRSEVLYRLVSVVCGYRSHMFLKGPWVLFLMGILYLSI